MDTGRSSDVNISDVIEVIETDEMYAGVPPNNGEPDSRRTRPCIKIIEQPASKALRFRYECEGRSAGSIPGVNSTPENKTYPGIQIVGLQGRAVVVVSCVTKEAPYRPHPHNLVGKEGCSRGICTLTVTSDTVTFSNLGIQCVKKKDIEEALKVREELRVDPYRTGFSHKGQPSSIDLNSVRLCFQVFLEGPVKDKFTIPLRPVVSDPIYDKKAMSDLTICKLSDCSASVAGGKEIILLCEKVAKEDIQVRFYEERDGDLYWEGLGDFQPTQVHKQVAISFRTPKYKNIDVEKPVKAWVQLRRPSDGATSESVAFQFVPLDSGRATFWSMRRALSKKGDYNTFSKILQDGSFLSLEAQKRKFDSLTSSDAADFNERKKPLVETYSEFQNQKDSLISGGNPIVVPKSGDHTKVPDLDNLNSKKELVVKETSLLNNSNGISSKNDFSMQDKNIEKTFMGNEKGFFDSEPESKFEETMKTVQRNTDAENSQSFNDLIMQVAELDEIYAETQEKLLLSHSEMESQLDDVTMDCSQSFKDNQTYTSLQMAMKNPVNLTDNRNYEDVPFVQGPIIDISKPKILRQSNKEDEKLPPLPPKRVKKTPPRRPEASPLTKDLPKIPENAKNKQNLFQKLFSKNKSNVSKMKTSRSSESLKFSSRSPTHEEKISSDGQEKTDKAFAKWLHRGSTGSLIESNLRMNLENSDKENSEIDKSKKELGDFIEPKDDLELELELTEAENYALYTTLAPHASMTELDEISFYYSPVEKGRILNEPSEQKLQNVALKNIARSQNVT